MSGEKDLELSVSQKQIISKMKQKLNNTEGQSKSMFMVYKLFIIEQNPIWNQEMLRQRLCPVLDVESGPITFWISWQRKYTSTIPLTYSHIMTVTMNN